MEQEATIEFNGDTLYPVSEGLKKLYLVLSEEFPEYRIRPSGFRKDGDKNLYSDLMVVSPGGHYIYVRPKETFFGEGEAAVHTGGYEDEVDSSTFRRLEELAKKYGVELNGDIEEFWVEYHAETIEDSIKGIRIIVDFLNEAKL